MRALNGVIAVCLALALPGAPLRASAEASSCNSPRSVVDRTICADPTLTALQTRLAEAYSGALARDRAQAAEIQADQANWLAERDDRSWSAVRSPDPGLQLGMLGTFYRRRIAFLDSVGREPARPDPIVAAVLRALASPDSDDPNVLGALRQGAVATAPWTREVSAPVVQALAELPAPPAPGLRAALEKAAGRASPVVNRPPGTKPRAADADRTGPLYGTIAWLPRAGLGGWLRIEGSLGCRDWVMFRKEGDRLHLVATPEALSAVCEVLPTTRSTSRIELLAGQPVAIRQSIDALGYQTDLRWQRWTGSGWGRPMQVTVRFREALSADSSNGGVACAPSVPQAGCYRVQQEVLDIANRYARRPLPGTLDPGVALTPDERTEFADMEAAARRNAYPGQSIPAFGTGIAARSGTFRRATATYFLTHLDGRLVLGVIGHGHGEAGVALPDWLVALWGWQDGKLVPLVGAAIWPFAKDVLLAAEVPVPPAD